MVVKNRRLVKPEDLNPRGTLFGGRLLEWIDEEAAIFTICQLGTDNIVTKLMSEINFVSPAKSGDVVEIGMEVVKIGRTSITLKCQVLNKNTKTEIITIDKMVFVSVDENGKSTPHGVIEKNQRKELIKSLTDTFNGEYSIDENVDGNIYIINEDIDFAEWDYEDFTKENLIEFANKVINDCAGLKGEHVVEWLNLAALILKTLNDE